MLHGAIALVGYAHDVPQWNDKHKNALTLLEKAMQLDEALLLDTL